MSQLRTYRILPLLVGLAFLFGAAAPKWHAACAVMTDRAQETEMPCHPQQEPRPSAPEMHSDGLGMPCCGAARQVAPVCCPSEGMVASAATTPSEAGPRLFALLPVGVLAEATQRASAQPSVLLDTRARAPAFTSTTLRQAFLATFLI